MKNVPTNLSNLKSKVDKLDLDKVVPADLSKLNDVVKNDVVKKDVYNLATTTAITAVENKIPSVSM